MKKGMKSVLTATILLTLSSVLGVQAADTTLEEVIVTADRTRITEDSAGSVYAGGYVGTNPSIGILGSKDYTKMPIQATSVTAQVLSRSSFQTTPFLKQPHWIPLFEHVVATPTTTSASVVLILARTITLSMVFLD